MWTVGTVEVIFCRKYGGLFQGLFLDVFFLPVLPWPQRLPKAFCFICLGNWFAAGRKYKNNRQPLSESANMYRALLRIRVSPLSVKIWSQTQLMRQSQCWISEVVFNCPSRCGFCGGAGLPPGLGHPVLDQLHHVHHQQTHPGPEPSGRLRERSRGHSVRGRPSTRAGPGWVPKVSHAFKTVIFDIGF